MSKPPPSYRSTIAALAAGQIVCWAALFYTFSSFVLPMQRALGWGKPVLMGAFTVALVVWGTASYAVGVAIDRGRGRAVMTLGSLLAAIGFAMWASANSIALLYAAWAVLGAAMSMTLYEPAFSVLTRRFPDRFLQGITTLTLVGGFASTLAFPAAAWLIRLLEWRGALWAFSGVLLLSAPLHAWALRGTPVSAGDPDGVATATDRRGDADLRSAARHAPFWLLTAAFTCYNFVGAALWVHLMPALAAKGLSDAQALAVVVWFGPAQVFSRIVYFRFGRSLARRTLGLLVLGGAPLALLVFALAERSAALLVFALLFGLINGLATIFRGSVVPDYFGRGHVGRISGVMTAVTMLVRATAPIATAWLLLAVPGYRELILAMAAIAFVALLCLAFAGAPAAASASSAARAS